MRWCCQDVLHRRVSSPAGCRRVFPRPKLRGAGVAGSSSGGRAAKKRPDDVQSGPSPEAEKARASSRPAAEQISQPASSSMQDHQSAGAGHSRPIPVKTMLVQYQSKPCKYESSASFGLRIAMWFFQATLRVPCGRWCSMTTMDCLLTARLPHPTHPALPTPAATTLVPHVWLRTLRPRADPKRTTRRSGRPGRVARRQSG
jgi:hypothetical protein